MKTAEKALKLLDYFSVNRHEIGLSEMARISSTDKATTHRLLRVLARRGFVEQHKENKKYRLGASLLRLARLREATAPATSIIQPVLDGLAKKCGETVHASLIAGATLSVVAVAESTHSTRVYIEPGLQLPLHATASGIAFLGFADPAFVDKVLSRKLAGFTDMTITDPQGVRDAIRAAHQSGIGIIEKGFDEDVISIGAPIFDGSGLAGGAISIATPMARASDEKRLQNRLDVLDAAIEITQNMGAVPHPALLTLLKELSA